ncbi:MAG: hypothetical protein ABSG94_12850 [Brevinematales bacterium]|jgi:O-antigen/teichoic acid export membrane protein
MKDFIRINFKKLITNRIFLNSSLISVITVGVGAIDFFYTVFIGRMLGQEQYGIYNPLISLMVIAGIPGLALQMVFSADISRLIHNREHRALKDYLKKAFIITLATAALIIGMLWPALPVLKDYIHIGDNRPFYFLFAMAAMTLLTIPFQSLIQSREDYNKYIIYKLTATISKFILGVGFVYFLTGYLGALSGFLAAICIGAIYLIGDFYFFAKKKPDLENSGGFIKSGKILKSFLNGFLSVFAFQLFIYLDSILVRHYLPELSGVYSMVIQFGKASLFIALAISFVMLPFMSKDRENMARSNVKGFLFLLAILVSFCVFLSLISRFLSGVIFAGKFPGMENILPLYAFMFLPYSLINFLINYYIISQKLFYSIAIFAGVIMLYFGIMAFHKDLIQVSFVIGAVGYSVLAVLMADSFLWHKRKKIFNLM